MHCLDRWMQLSLLPSEEHWAELNHLLLPAFDDERTLDHTISTQFSLSTDTLQCFYHRFDLRQRRHMTSLVSSPPVPSELDGEVDDTDLPFGHIWAYPCKLCSRPDYGKPWSLRSSFFLHLQEREAHGTSATTPSVYRAIEID